MKCIQCGKKITAEGTVLCSNCFAQKNTCLASYNPQTLLICSHCGSYKYNKEWKKKKSKEEAIQETVLSCSQFTHQPDALDMTITQESVQGKKEKGTLFLRTETTIDGQRLREEFPLPYSITFTRCDQCTKLTTSYFEGILQLRGSKNTLFEKVHSFILADAAAVKEKGVAISKIEEVRNGIDYYYTKQQYLPIITQKLIDQFGAVGKTHPELYTKNRQTSKDVYRVNASVRLPDFDVGTVVVYKNHVVKISKLGRQIYGEDIQTKKRVLLDDRSAIRIVAHPSDYRKVEVLQWHPHPTILHPETFQHIPLMNPKYLEEEKKYIFIVLIDDKAWVVDF